MTGGELFLCALVVALLYGGLANSRAAYRNGVTDGYGYAREPENPGYAAAGQYLRKHMGHRWWELLADGQLPVPFHPRIEWESHADGGYRPDNRTGTPIPPQGGSGTTPPREDEFP